MRHCNIFSENKGREGNDFSYFLGAKQVIVSAELCKLRRKQEVSADKCKEISALIDEVRAEFMDC